MNLQGEVQHQEMQHCAKKYKEDDILQLSKGANNALSKYLQISLVSSVNSTGLLDLKDSHNGF